MAQSLFSSQDTITQDWLLYIENEARGLSQLDDFGIQNYIDRELLNPEVKAYLHDEFSESDGDDSAAGLYLSFTESSAAAQAGLFGGWRKLKQKIRKIFCDVVGSFSGDIDWKDIIKAVLVALIPAFAGGIPALTLPIIIGLVASLMKYGYNQVCPS